MANKHFPTFPHVRHFIKPSHLSLPQRHHILCNLDKLLCPSFAALSGMPVS